MIVLFWASLAMAVDQYTLVPTEAASPPPGVTVAWQVPEVTITNGTPTPVLVHWTTSALIGPTGQAWALFPGEARMRDVGTTAVPPMVIPSGSFITSYFGSTVQLDTAASTVAPMLLPTTTSPGQPFVVDLDLEVGGERVRHRQGFLTRVNPIWEAEQKRLAVELRAKQLMARCVADAKVENAQFRGKLTAGLIVGGVGGIATGLLGQVDGLGPKKTAARITGGVLVGVATVGITVPLLVSAAADRRDRTALYRTCPPD